MKKKIDFQKLKLLILDVDGVLTDATITINGDGTESKSFNSLDGHGIRMWKRAGLKVVFLSGRDSLPTDYRAKQLEIDLCVQNSHVKKEAFEEILQKFDMKPENVVYIGDDLPDLPVIRAAGFGVAVANAVAEVKRDADYVTSRAGGAGAVREVIELILKETGKWQQLMQRYLS